MPFDEVELKPEIAGRVVKMNLPEGRFVKSGTLLVKLYDEDLQASLKNSNPRWHFRKNISAAIRTYESKWHKPE